MYLNELDYQYLINSIRNVCDKPVFIVSLNWKILATTHEKMSGYVREILSSCKNENSCSQAADQFGILMEPCLIRKTLICYFMILDKRSSYLIPYLNTMVELLITPQISDLHSQSANSRSMLVNQISNTDRISSETDSFMKEFDYSYKCPRAAVLFEICQQSGAAVNYKFDSSETNMEGLILHHPRYSKEDIFGFLSSERYVVFKDMSDAAEEENEDTMKQYVSDLAASVKELQGLNFHIAVGSVYKDLSDLRKSYLEALFLINNYDYLNTEEDSCLFIHNFIFEFMTSQIPNDYWDNCFAQLSRTVGESPVLLETLISLSRNDQNLTRAAEKLGLHRNTMLQRFSKLKSLTGLNPMEKDVDRMVFRTFALHLNQKIMLQAGIVIQPNSVLHQGMQKMAELVNRNSNGTININIHTLSVSGNNDHLFEILRSGSVDMVVIATGVMNKFTNNRTRILDFPFLFRSSSEAKYILNNLIIRDLESTFESIGVKCLNIWTMGWRYLTSKEPVHVPQDMVGKTVRVMFTECLDEYYRNMGAIPVKMNYGDVKDALSSGIIDCQENPYSNILGMKFYEEQSYITRLKYYLSTEALYISKNAWCKLTAHQKEIISNAARETTDWIFKEQQNVINQKCKYTLVHEKGMKIVEIKPEEEELWRSYSQSFYAATPHQDLLKKIEQARKEYYAKYGTDQTVSGV